MVDERERDWLDPPRAIFCFIFKDPKKTEEDRGDVDEQLGVVALHQLNNKQGS